MNEGSRTAAPMPLRLRTIVVDGPLALQMRRLEAARAGEVGLQIFTLAQLAAHIAGGLRGLPRALTSKSRCATRSSMAAFRRLGLLRSYRAWSELLCEHLIDYGVRGSRQKASVAQLTG